MTLPEIVYYLMKKQHSYLSIEGYYMSPRHNQWQILLETRNPLTPAMPIKLYARIS